ncbi:MAG: heme o synthase [Planctomycetota bacterium]
MSTGVTVTAAEAARPNTLRARLADYAALAKPRISLLELVTVGVAYRFAVAAGGEWSPTVFMVLMVGTTLLAASANTLNQYLEIKHDRRMFRTADRPLPAGRMRPSEAAWFGLVSLAVSITLIAFGVGPVPAAIGLVCWWLYVGVYTPLKRHSTFNTTVGAVSGALPIVMGWTAGGGSLDGVAMGLFAVLLLWQYPHFMAIAWLCKDDYARGGYRMSTVVDPTGRWAGVQAVAGAALLAPAALYPAAIIGGDGSVTYACLAVLLAVLQLVYAVAFYRNRTDLTARRLLRASLLYLPGWMLALSLCLP